MTSMPLLALALAAASPEPRLQVVDLVGEFDRVIDETAELPETEQAAKLRQRFATLLPGFYDPARLGMTEADYDKRIGREMAGYRKVMRTGAAKVRARFNGMIAPAIADFEKSVGPLPSGRKVYLVVSMGEFDGATRRLPGSPNDVLLFGADMIAKYHGDSSARAFVQHELFHVYHQQRFDGCGENWCGLWQEGLATHVAATLNPGASDSDLLLTIPEPIRPELEANKADAVCAVRSRLDGDKDRNALFSFQRLSPTTPPRFAYLVGAWVAADLGKGRTLTQLAELNGPPLKAAIERSLDGMASCP